MDINPQKFRETLHKIPFAEDSWSDLISLIKVSTESQAGVMLITRDNDHDIIKSHSPDFQISPEVRDAFEKSEWITAAMPDTWKKEYLNRGVVLGTDIIAQEKMRKTPFYQEILNSLGLEYLMAGVSFYGSDYRTLLKFFRAQKQDNFNTDNTALLGGLMPEIRQMMRFTERLYERMVVETAETKSGAPNGAATIIINHQGKIVHLNNEAEKILSAGKVLSAKQDHLFAIDSLDRNKLSETMASALGSNSTAAQSCSLIGESTDAGVHQLLTLPVPIEEPPFPWMETLQVAAVVVIDPMRKVKIDPAILKTLYGITPAEVDLVNAIANGIKPVQFAQQTGKSIPTVQSQRQSVFQKINVNNQLELMSMLRNLTTTFEDISAIKH
jgi:DNA-binding CsgD family transcriptional regulator